MGPPTEQLIRDYLNRLSVAARDRLGPEDRRALVDRTRKLIERKADFAGRPSTLEVGKVLARLGDPVVLVEQEWHRLAAVRRDQPDRSAAPAESAESWEPAEQAAPGGGRGFFASVLRRGPGRWSWRSSAGWPTAVPSENGVAHGEDAALGIAPAKPRWPSAGAQNDGTTAYPQPDLPVRNGTMTGAGMVAADPRRAEAGDGDAATTNGSNGTGAVNGTGGVNGAGGVNGTGGVSGTAAFDADAGEEFETPDVFAVGGRAVGLLGRLAAGAWEHPLEATAIILLGLGGAIFPPIFVLGAAVALGSRLWHYRDKWAGLVLPPVLTIIVAAAAIAVGGRSHGLHDAWVWLNVVSRIAALAGAGYLAWRTGPGRRPPPQPPWHKPRRAT
jgi:hypothetical protein